MSTTTTIDWDALDQFIGSEEKYRGTLARWCLHTEGMRHVFESAKCYWLLDVVASHQMKRQVRREPFQLWAITRQKSNPNAATVTCRRDSTDKPLVTQHIPYTDFPFPESGSFEFYACWDDSNLTVMLKSEY